VYTARNNEREKAGVIEKNVDEALGQHLRKEKIEVGIRCSEILLVFILLLTR
jgi:hypothetical protein